MDKFSHFHIRDLCFFFVEVKIKLRSKNEISRILDIARQSSGLVKLVRF